MIVRVVKYGGITVAALTIGGLVLFGTDLFSYARTSVNEVRSSAKEAVPLDFELARARDMLDEVLPELHANVKLIASEEVEIAELKSDIEMSEAALHNEKGRLSKLRNRLDSSEVRFVISGSQYDRDDLTQELSRSFDRYRDAEIALEGKRRLLRTREKSLNAAIKMLDEARGKKIALEDRIAALEGQYRLVKAASQSSEFQIDDSKLAKTERLIQNIKKRLDVAERTLAHEAKFAEGITFESVVNEQDLLAEVDSYFNPDPAREVMVDVEEEAPVAAHPRISFDN